MRYLNPSEHHLIAPVFTTYGCEPPTDGRILVTEDTKGIASLQCIHKVLHAGPVWVRPDQRGKGLWQQMQRQVEADLPPNTYFYQFGTDSNQKRLHDLGLTPLGWTVWGKRTT